MATEKECSEYNNCGFIAYLKSRGSINPNCGKAPIECGRLDPVVPFKLEARLPQSRSEIEVAFPVIYESNDGKTRRVLRGTHR